ncbi:hypothetical protein GCM10010278_59750 [Streptomyces melanogenes]|nr:hypothetical protein GCM10010278_59750 [Streptomyces melanogenes]
MLAPFPAPLKGGGSAPCTPSRALRPRPPYPPTQNPAPAQPDGNGVLLKLFRRTRVANAGRVRRWCGYRVGSGREGPLGPYRWSIKWSAHY